MEDFTVGTRRAKRIVTRRKRIAIRTSLAASLGAGALMVTAVLAQADPDGDSGTANCNAVATQGNATVSQVVFSADLDANPTGQDELDVNITPSVPLNVRLECDVERGINAPASEYTFSIFAVNDGSSSSCPQNATTDFIFAQSGQDVRDAIQLQLRLEPDVAAFCKQIGVAVKDLTP